MRVNTEQQSLFHYLDLCDAPATSAEDVEIIEQDPAAAAIRRYQLCND
jgi:hypothetical protein